jgi:hypothetical protein
MFEDYLAKIAAAQFFTQQVDVCQYQQQNAQAAAQAAMAAYQAERAIYEARISNEPPTKWGEFEEGEIVEEIPKPFVFNQFGLIDKSE